MQTPAAYLLFYRRRTDRPIGGKTHDFLASQTVSPALSASESAGNTASGLDDHSFRNSLSGDGGSITSPYFAPQSQYRVQYGNELSQPSDTEIDLGDGEDESSGPGSRSYPSPTMTDDEDAAP